MARGYRTTGQHFSGAALAGLGAAQAPSVGEEKQERNVGIRETINKNPGPTTAATAGIIGVALLFIMWQCGVFGGAGSGGGSSKAFFTIDDGKTFFIDDASKIPPFKKDNKDAFRAHVFTCDGGKTKFVGYMEAYAPQDKKLMEDTIAGKAPPQPYPGYTGQAMVKAPGVGAFIPLMPGTTEQYAKIVQVTCKENPSAIPERVYPED